MTFTVTRLANSQAIVQGTDHLGNSGRLLLSTFYYDDWKTSHATDTAKEEFDSAVEDFFAPLMAAAEKLDAARNKPDPIDPMFTVVTGEKVEGTDAVHQTIEILDLNTAILRAVLDLQDTSRLIWIDDKTLGFTEFVPPAEPEVEVAVPDLSGTPTHITQNRGALCLSNCSSSTSRRWLLA